MLPNVLSYQYMSEGVKQWINELMNLIKKHSI